MSLPATQCERESCEAALPQYAELHCLSNFTFLRGASHPHELVEQADSLGYAALAITDERSEEHTSELQSQSNLVCRLLLEKKKKTHQYLSLLQLTHPLQHARPDAPQL